MKDWESLKKSAFKIALTLLQNQFDLFAPVKNEEEVRLNRISSTDIAFLGAKKTLLPLKTFFFPEVEDMFSYNLKNKTPGFCLPASDGREKVVLGCLACDIAALKHLDLVFLQAPLDSGYKKRREQTTLIAYACQGEGSECFCHSFGINPLLPEGADAVLFDAGETYLFKVLSAKGEKIKKLIQSLLEKPGKSEMSRFTAASPAVQKELFINKLSADTNALWDLPLWQDLAATCLGCNICTILCPTCHCFDLEDEKRGLKGKRYRFYDSCMRSGFTRMASGENPRPTKMERIRQRFLHKLCYFLINNKQVACVGCGRCVKYCPVGIGIDSVIARLTGKEGEYG